MLRQAITWIGLVLTLLACWWVNQQEQAQQEQETLPTAVAKPARNIVHHKRPTVIYASQAHTPLLLRPADTAPPVDLFSALPQADAATAQPVSVPAPVNPYTYEGRVHDGTQWVVFLTDGAQQFAVRQGEHIANGWKVSRLTEHTLVLQNGKERHTLNLSTANESAGEIANNMNIVE